MDIYYIYAGILLHLRLWAIFIALMGDFIIYGYLLHLRAILLYLWIFITFTSDFYYIYDYWRVLLHIWIFIYG